MRRHNHLQEDGGHGHAHLILHVNDACNDASPQPFEAYIFLSNNHKSGVKYSSQ
jgi:hypothetical protein